MMEDKGGTMTTAITNPKKITLEDLEEKFAASVLIKLKKSITRMQIS